MTLANVQPFCKKFHLDIGVYNLNRKKILPQSVKEKIFIHVYTKSIFCVLWKVNRNSVLIDTFVEIENSSKYGETQKFDIILKQVVEYKFPIPYELNCLINVFAFDLETCNVEALEYCEPHAAGVYHLKNLYECFNGALNKEELAFERSKVQVFDRENGNPVLKMMDYFINN